MVDADVYLRLGSEIQSNLTLLGFNNPTPNELS